MQIIRTKNGQTSVRMMLTVAGAALLLVLAVFGYQWLKAASAAADRTYVYKILTTDREIRTLARQLQTEISSQHPDPRNLMRMGYAFLRHEKRYQSVKPPTKFILYHAYMQKSAEYFSDVCGEAGLDVVEHRPIRGETYQKFARGIECLNLAAREYQRAAAP